MEQREIDNMLLSMIQKHFPSLPLSDEYTDWGKGLGFARCLREQLAALAEQNEKMRKVLLRLACLGNGDQYGNSIGNCIAQEALSLPDLASPVLNRIRAEGMEMAAKWFNDHVDNRTDTWQAQELRRMAAELRNTNG